MFKSIWLGLVLVIASVLIAANFYSTASEPETPMNEFEELGDITWYRNAEQARAAAKASGKPLLVFYTELPGCLDCKNYGQHQLRHPIVVDAAAEFIPLAVAYVGWPKVDFLAADGTKLGVTVPYSSGVGPLLAGMASALTKAGKKVPDYLAFAASQYTPATTEKATFGMGCFWHGENVLGRINGVLTTQAGALNGEVVELTFNPGVISYAALVKETLNFKCGDKIVARSDAQAATARSVLGASGASRVQRSDTPITAVSGDDNKHALKSDAALARLPLTPLQATKLNAAVVKPDEILSPSQKAWLKSLQALSAAQLSKLPAPEDYTDNNTAQIKARLVEFLKATAR